LKTASQFQQCADSLYKSAEQFGQNTLGRPRYQRAIWVIDSHKPTRKVIAGQSKLRLTFRSPKKLFIWSLFLFWKRLLGAVGLTPSTRTPLMALRAAPIYHRIDLQNSSIKQLKYYLNCNSNPDQKLINLCDLLPLRL
jgi:hypothetical protein